MKYIYFISFAFTNKKGLGFGNVIAERNCPILTGEDKDVLQKELAADPNTPRPIILNIILLNKE